MREPDHYEDFDAPVRSTRFFRWPREQIDWYFLWMTGTDENCNRTLGVRVPFAGAIFVVLNRHIRQEPCGGCLAMLPM